MLSASRSSLRFRLHGSLPATRGFRRERVATSGEAFVTMDRAVSLVERSRRLERRLACKNARPTPVGKMWKLEQPTSRSASGRVHWRQGVGLLSTAGDLVFAGDASKHLPALDDKDGHTLWHGTMGANQMNGGITYELDRRQCVIFGGGDLVCIRAANAKVTFAPLRVVRGPIRSGPCSHDVTLR